MHCPHSRAAFLTGGVAATAAAAIPRGIGAQAAVSQRRNIDVHQHILPLKGYTPVRVSDSADLLRRSAQGV